MSLRDAFAYQAESNRRLGSPFTARLLDRLAKSLHPGTDLTDRMFDWPGDLGPSGQSLPLRFLAGLHALVLKKDCPALMAIYPPKPSPTDAQIDEALQVALDRPRRDFGSLAGHAPANERGPPRSRHDRRRPLVGTALCVANARAGTWRECRAEPDVGSVCA